MGSGLRDVAPRSLSRENAGSIMTLLHHALCGDDFDQTPVSIIFRETVEIYIFWFCGGFNTGGMVLPATYRSTRIPVSTVCGPARNQPIISPRFRKSPPVCVVCCACFAARALNVYMPVSCGTVEETHSDHVVLQYLEYQQSRFDVIQYSTGPLTRNGCFGSSLSTLLVCPTNT